MPSACLYNALIINTPPWTCSRTAEPFHLFIPRIHQWAHHRGRARERRSRSIYSPPRIHSWGHSMHHHPTTAERLHLSSSGKVQQLRCWWREGGRAYPTNEFVGLSKWNSSAIHLAGRQPWHAVMIYSWGNSHRRQVAVGVTIIVCPRGDSP